MKTFQGENREEMEEKVIISIRRDKKLKKNEYVIWEVYMLDGIVTHAKETDNPILS